MKKRLLVLMSTLIVGLVVSSFNLKQFNRIVAEEVEEPVNPYGEPPEGYTRYEMEDGILFNCYAKGKMEGAPADYGTYSGQGFVGSIDYNDSSITLNVVVPEEGNYPIFLGYAIDPGFSNASFNIYINDDLYQTWTLKQKNGWGSFASTVPYIGSLNLFSGSNRIKLLRGYGYCELDYLDVGQKTGSFIDPGEAGSDIGKVPEGYTRYEAELGTVSDGRIYEAIGSCSGRGYVGDLDHSGTSSVSWSVEVPEDGEYQLRFGYAIGTGFEDASLKLYNNEGLYGIFTMTEKNGWGVFIAEAFVLTTISLRQGVNNVSIAKSMNYAQIDYMDVSNEKIGEYKEGGISYNYPNLLDGYTRYEAEEQLVVLAEPKGIDYFMEMGHYSGGGFVGSMDKDSYYVEFPMNVSEDGEYQIRVAYAAFETGASLKLYNGTYGRGGKVYFDKEIFATAAHGWGEFEEDTIIDTTISIKAGRSFILVRSGFIRCELDYIDLGSKVGPYIEGTYDSTLDRNN